MWLKIECDNRLNGELVNLDHVHVVRTRNDVDSRSSYELRYSILIVFNEEVLNLEYKSESVRDAVYKDLTHKLGA